MAKAPAAAAEWWRGCTIYEIYPRSFMDANGDGIGDLRGIAARLDYVASLEVDGIWIAPFFTSPMADFGYDVSDYCDVDPVFGTLADFDALLARAHRLGLKVIIDQVYAHSSDRHPWFAESRQARDTSRSDWYVWADARADGSPPNNWQSVFAGPAWTWDARRGQYYLHNFLPQQPQLNLHNRAVQDALLEVARFWLDRGVDGFRFDAFNFAMHNPLLPDNPPAPPGPRTRPFDFQLHLENQSQPEIPAFIERIRALTDGFRECYTLAEIGGVNAAAEMRDYTAGTARFHSAYSFDFLEAEALSAQTVADALAQWPDAPAGELPSWAFSNHDVPRWISRWAPPDSEEPFAHMAMLLFACLPGNLILWQGEELGLAQADVPFELLRDPEAIANWPLTKGRDGARTPMVWEHAAIHAGFTTGRPWLPFGQDHKARAADAQAGDPGSLLNLTRSLLALRRRTGALRLGKTGTIEVSGSVLSFTRRFGASEVLCAANFSQTPCAGPASAGEWRELAAVNGASFGQLTGYGAVVVERGEP